MNINDAINELIIAKASEEAAKTRRLIAEDAVAVLIPGPIEGSRTAVSGKIKVTVTRKLNRSLDFDTYQQVEESLPENMRFVRYKPEIDLKILRTVEAADPMLVAKCVTTKPAKTQIKIETVK